MRLPVHKPLRLLLRRIDAFVFPPLCIVCDQPRPDHDRWLCEQCRDDITTQITRRDGCPKCGQDRSIRTCTCDIAWDYPFSRIRSFVDYNDTVKSIMQHIKYQGKRNLAEYIGRLCGSHLTADEYTGTVVVPIPLHRQRRRKRGYNQAEWFARGLFADSSATVSTTILQRVRSTGTQTKLDRSQRQRNLAGAFSLTREGPAMITGRKVLLVDDVITTGATTMAAATVLLKGGCSEVEVLSFARD